MRSFVELGGGPLELAERGAHFGAGTRLNLDVEQLSGPLERGPYSIVSVKLLLLLREVPACLRSLFVFPCSAHQFLAVARFGFLGPRVVVVGGEALERGTSCPHFRS